MSSTRGVISHGTSSPVTYISKISKGNQTVYQSLDIAFRDWETPHEQEIREQLVTHGVPINDCRFVRISSESYIGVGPAYGDLVNGKKWYAIFGKHYIGFSSNDYQKVEFCDQACRTRNVAPEIEEVPCSDCYLSLSQADLAASRVAHEWCK